MYNGNTGNVGIGTINPQALLHVATNNQNTELLRLSAGTNQQIQMGVTGWDGYIGVKNGSGVAADYINSNGVSYFNGGNVGIGTTVPAGKFDVEGGETHLSGGTYSDPNSGTARDLKLGSNGLAVNGGIVVNSGNVGIGTTVPSNKLHVLSSVAGDFTGIAITNNNSGWVAGYGSSLSLRGDGNGGDRDMGKIGAYWSNAMDGSSAYMAFSTRNSEALSEKMRITSAGNVGIGTTNPGYALDVSGVIHSSSDIRLGGDIHVGGQVIVGSGDLAEDFYTDKIYPAGTVLVMDDNGYKSARACDKKYDTTVIGVISENPGLVIGQLDGKYKAPIALTGVIKVRVNSSGGQIHQGDLLTTSAISGEAMKATSPKVGTCIGKALENDTGKGYVMAIVNLK
jgi:hypothetical protein